MTTNRARWFFGTALIGAFILAANSEIRRMKEHHAAQAEIEMLGQALDIATAKLLKINLARTNQAEVN